MEIYPDGVDYNTLTYEQRREAQEQSTFRTRNAMITERGRSSRWTKIDALLHPVSSASAAAVGRWADNVDDVT